VLLLLNGSESADGVFVGEDNVSVEEEANAKSVLELEVRDSCGRVTALIGSGGLALNDGDETFLLEDLGFKTGVFCNATGVYVGDVTDLCGLGLRLLGRVKQPSSLYLVGDDFLGLGKTGIVEDDDTDEGGDDISFAISGKKSSKFLIYLDPIAKRSLVIMESFSLHNAGVKALLRVLESCLVDSPCAMILLKKGNMTIKRSWYWLNLIILRNVSLVNFRSSTIGNGINSIGIRGLALFLMK